MKFLAGSSHAHIHQPALFMQTAWLIKGANVWKSSLLTSDDKDIVELKSFGGVQGH